MKFSVGIDWATQAHAVCILDQTGRVQWQGSVPHTADGNVHLGVAYLSHLLHAFNGDERLALAGWYQGERAVRKHGPYKVTRPFVANVLALRTRM